MKTTFIKLFCLAALSVSTLSCKKDYDDKNLDPLAPSFAEVPVTVTNAEFNERFPGVTASVANGGRFTINFQIPSDKGTIREITRVTTTTPGAANYTTLNAASAASAYNATGTGAARVVTPIPGNGSNQISFTSTLADYLPYRVANGAGAGPIGGTAAAPAIPAPSSTATPTDIQFYFRFTLENGQSIISTPVKVRVVP